MIKQARVSIIDLELQLDKLKLQEDIVLSNLPIKWLLENDEDYKPEAGKSYRNLKSMMASLETQISHRWHRIIE